MAIIPRKRKQLLKVRKRRDAKRGSTPVIQSRPLTMKHRERQRYTEKCPALLLKIEASIVDAWQADPKLDDGIVSDALESLIRGSQCTNKASQLCARLNAAFAGIPSVQQSEWIDGLRAIYTSVRDHRTQPPRRNYLSFAQRFVANAIER